jgi:hypothetical protein
MGFHAPLKATPGSFGEGMRNNPEYTNRANVQKSLEKKKTKKALEKRIEVFSRAALDIESLPKSDRAKVADALYALYGS